MRAIRRWVGTARRVWWAVPALLVLFFVSPASAQTKPAEPTPPIGIEAQPVERGRVSTTAPSNDGVNWQRLVTATVVVLVMIVLLRYAAGWLMPGAMRGGGGRGVRVLGRTSIAPRQQVVLLHVGRRILVVGDSGGQLANLGTIDDAEEVAELLGQTSSTPPATATGRFKAMFGRATDTFVPPERVEAESLTADDDVEGQPADPNVEAARDEISGLLDRMRSLTKSVKR